MTIDPFFNFSLIQIGVAGLGDGLDGGSVVARCDRVR